MNLSGIFQDSRGLFVSDAGDVYIDMGKYNGRVERWTPGAGSGQMVMNVSGSCFSLFIDSNDTLYCSLDLLHQVVQTSLSSTNISASILVAGTGAAGSASNMLNNPGGIFVDTNIGLHVADCGNNRVQLFQPGQANGNTLAGNGLSGTIVLSCPIAVTLDFRGYLYILDLNNYRIVGSGPDGFRCLMGCTGTGGSNSDQLSDSSSFSFDREGNMLVSDADNQRIQKFLVSTTSCSAYILMIWESFSDSFLHSSHRAIL